MAHSYLGFDITAAAFLVFDDETERAMITFDGYCLGTVDGRHLFLICERNLQEQLLQVYICMYRAQLFIFALIWEKQIQRPLPIGGSRPGR